MGRPHKHDPEIDVLPYMDSMVIVLNLICLIIIIMIIPIIENAKQVSALSFEKLLRSKENKSAQKLSPIYFDCRSDGVTILPGDVQVPVESLVQPGNEVEKVINRVQARSDEEYVILLVRPHSLPVYRYVRKEVLRRGILAGFDVIDSNVVLDWQAEAKKLRLRLKPMLSDGQT